MRRSWKIWSTTGSTHTKVLLSLAAVGLAGSMAGLGTFATFTDTQAQAGQDIDSGTVTITLGDGVVTANRLTVDATGLVPGDTIQRAVDLTNTGNQNLASITLTTEATSTSLLDTDTTTGLQLTVDKCSAPWTESGPPYTYTCGGSTSTVLASQPVVGTPSSGHISAAATLSNMSALTAGSNDHLRVTLTLPSGAGNALQNQSSTLKYTFTATQRAATAK
jgi:spore coat-associated protein N